MKRNKDSIAIIGLGKVGTAIGYLLRQAGYVICALVDESPSAAQKAIPYTAADVHSIPSLATLKTDCFIITTVDDAIAGVCSQLSKAGVFKPGNKVIHMSGVGGLDLLNPAREKGAFAASIHPVQSFADIDGAINAIPGSVFGVTANDEIKIWCVKLVEDLKGVPFFIQDADKPLYHAAACMASNYLTTLLHIVVEMYKILGLKNEDIARAYLPLVKGTLTNIENKGPIQALTGPIARGDMGTVEKHLKVIEAKMPQYLDAYKELGRITADVGRLKGTISTSKAESIKELLKGGRTND